MAVSKGEFSSHLSALYKQMIESMQKRKSKDNSMVVMWLTTLEERLVNSEWRLFCATSSTQIDEYENLLADLATRMEHHARDQIGQHLHRARFRLQEVGNSPEPQDTHHVIFSAYSLSEVRQSALKKVVIPVLGAGL